MKLKKIASLMLAGIMAVSMLAACGEGKKDENPGSGSSSEAVTKTLTEAVLDKSSDYISNNVGTYNDEDLAKAMSYLAQSETVRVFKNTVTETNDVTFANLHNSAKKVITNSKYKNMSDNGWTYGNVSTSEDVKWWNLYVVGGSKDDNYVATEVAALLKNLSGFVSDKSVNYDLCVMKVEVKNENGTDATGVSTVIGVVLSADVVK